MDIVKRFEMSLTTKEKELLSMTDKHDIQNRSKLECEDENMRLSNDVKDKAG